MMAKRVEAVIIDLACTARLLWEVSQAEATARTVDTRWQSDKVKGALAVAYSILFWKERPGTVTVDVGTREAIREAAEQLPSRIQVFCWFTEPFPA